MPTNVENNGLRNSEASYILVETRISDQWSLEVCHDCTTHTLLGNKASLCRDVNLLDKTAAVAI